MICRFTTAIRQQMLTQKQEFMNVDDLTRYKANFWKIYNWEVIKSEDEFGPCGIPYARFEQWRLNNFGYRGPDIKIQKDPGKVRIICLGMSSTFGLYEDEENDWPRSLEGFAKAAMRYYEKELRPLSYRVEARVMDYPGGMPGKIGLFLRW